MSTEQSGADAYGQELARISHHQSEAIDARFTVFQALAAVGIEHEQADDIVAKLEAGAVAGAHTWISESSAPHGSKQRSCRTQPPRSGTRLLPSAGARRRRWTRWGRSRCCWTRSTGSGPRYGTRWHRR